MKAIIYLLICFSLASCAAPDVGRPPAVSPLVSVSGNALANNGVVVAAELTRRYNLAYPNCWSSETAPAFLCSGVVIRGTRAGPGFNVWDPSPTAKQVGGVAFSYLRSDTRIPRLYSQVNNGYIVYPALDTPSGMLALQYLCYFPIDGATGLRKDNGCGEHKLWGAVSRYCSLQNIFTAEQFLAHYMAQPPYREQRQCSFDVRDNSPYKTAALFREAVRAMYMIPKNGVNDENELIVKVWTDKPAIEMPLEAFFYLAGSSSGLAEAKGNQKSFYEQTNGKILPIIKLTIPASQLATFQYVAADQVYP